MQTIDQAKEAAIRADERRKIIEAYRQIGNIKKTAKHLGISQEKVTKLLDAAGYPRKKLNLTAASKTLCLKCANARADRCAFMAADVDKAEAVLQETGAEYKSKIYTYSYVRGTRDVTLLTVLKCPEYTEGDIVI